MSERSWTATADRSARGETVLDVTDFHLSTGQTYVMVPRPLVLSSGGQPVDTLRVTGIDLFVCEVRINVETLAIEELPWARVKGLFRR